VLQVQRPSDQEFAEKQDQIRETLLQQKQSELFEMFVSNLQTQMQKAGKIKINQQELKSLTKQQGGGEDEGE
jgi:hypothetical protein